MNETSFLSPKTDEEQMVSPDPGMTVLPNPSRKFRKRRRNRVLLFSFGVVLFIFFVVNGIAIGRFATGMLTARDALEGAGKVALDGEFVRAQELVDEGIRGLSQAHSGLSLLVWTYPIPWVGDQVEAISRSVDAGKSAAVALNDALIIASEAFLVIENAQDLIDDAELEGEVTFLTLPQSVRSELLETIHESLPELLDAQIQLRMAGEDLAKLEDLNVAPQIKEVIKPFQENLPTLITAVDLMIPFAATVDELAGVGDDRQWLMLFLNDMELRPGGGFIGVYGLTTLRDGEIVQMDVEDSYSVDKLVQFDPTYSVTPPRPITQHLNMHNWYFRDINWSPDFAVSASDARQVFRQQNAHAGMPVPEIHGVLGFTPTFASKIMEITGPVTVDGVTYTNENLPELLEYQVEFGFVDQGVEYDDRKEVVSRLSEVVIQRLTELPFSEYDRILNTFLWGIDAKHLMFYSTNESTQGAFVDAGWAGVIDADKTDDVVLIADANLGALKTDRVMEREIDYTIVPSADGYIATVKITYHHQGEFDQFTTRYRTYARAYAPLGSELVAASIPVSAVDVAEELGLTSFGAFTMIEPGQTGELWFSYKLPESIVDAIESGFYELVVYKQIGTKDHALTLDLDFGKKLQAALPSEKREHYGDTAYSQSTVLSENRFFTVEF